MFSEFAWNGICLFSRVFRRVHYLPMKYLNPETKLFEMQKPSARMFLSNLNLFLTWVAIPTYVAAQAMRGKMEVTATQTIFLSLEFSIGVLCVALFYTSYTDGENFCFAMNTFVYLEKFLRGQFAFKIKAPVEPKWYKDSIGIIINAVVLGLLVMGLSAPTLFIVTGVDPCNFLFPISSGSSFSLKLMNILVRFILCTLAATEIISSGGFANVMVMILTFIAKICIYRLKFHKSALLIKNKGKKEISKLASLSPLQIYQFLEVNFRIVRQYVDIGALIIITNGFIIDVFSNYVMICMMNSIPIFLYLMICMLSVVVGTFIMVELPKAGESNTLSIELIQHWKGSAVSYTGNKFNRNLRLKTLKSFHPLGICIGTFFVVRKQTTSTYVDGILNYTVDAILTV